MDYTINIDPYNVDDMIKNNNNQITILKRGRTIDDYMYIDEEGKKQFIKEYFGYKVLNITETEENIIIKVGDKVVNYPAPTLQETLQRKSIEELKDMLEYSKLELAKAKVNYVYNSIQMDINEIEKAIKALEG